MPTTLKQTEHFCTSALGDWLVTVQPADIGGIWGEVGPLLAKALVYSDDITLGQVRERLDRGEYQLWTAQREGVIDAAWCTRIADYPRGKVCEIALCGGEGIERWLELTIEPIALWAKDLGCVSLRIYGRKGWSKLLPDFREVSRVIERKI